MEHLTTGILRRSSDAVVIVGLPEGKVLDVNEAFFTVTGHARHELMGRPGRDLLIGLGQTADPTAVEVLEMLQDLGSLRDVPVGLWSRSGELRVGELSALVLEFEGRRDALCMIRGLRDPTPGQRRLMAMRELERILQSGDMWSEAATGALRAVGRCLRWERGALWRGNSRLENLHCAAAWRSTHSELGRLEETIRHAAVPAVLEPLAQVLLRGEPMWIPDLVVDSELPQADVGAGERLHGWLGFPALGPDGVIGAVEFVSRETRQPDPELLVMIGAFGRIFGRLLEDSEASDIPLIDVDPARPEAPEPSPGTMSSAFQDLTSAVTAATEVLEWYPTLRTSVSPSVLDELTAWMGKLNRLLKNAGQGGASGPSILEPSTPPARAAVDIPPRLPTGLTLKAVSRRTGIPAATLRTWEHRYKFLRPRRSASGYRLYGQEEIARIEEIKYLVGQGVRIGAAMRAVIQKAGGSELTDEAQHAVQGNPGENGQHEDVVRLSSPSPPSPRSRRSRSGDQPLGAEFD
jgi:DNA-binding transcriptional MerR regulator